MCSDIWFYIWLFSGCMLLVYKKNYAKTVYLGFILPGPSALPILGNVLQLTDNNKLYEIGTQFSTIYGRFMKWWISIIPVFVISDPKDLQIVLGNSKTTDKNMFYTFLHNFLGEGLITNSGEKWKRNRKMIQPHFTLSALKDLTSVFSKNAKAMIEKLKNNKNEDAINITNVINECVLKILHESILGVQLNEEDYSPFRSGAVVLNYRIMRPWMLFDWIFRWTTVSKDEITQKDKLQNYTKKILKEKLENNIGSSSNGALIDKFVEISSNNPQFSIDDIINESCTFMLAGQDSVGAAIVFSLYFLAKYQRTQEKVKNELDAIFKDNTGRDTTFEDLNDMKYLEQCIKEAMRLCPSVPVVTRKLLKDVPLGKYVFPKGADIVVSPFVTHRLPHVFPNPEVYDPDRFSSENQQKIPPFAYLPFLAGPRNCIGYKFAHLEMKMVISQLIRNYQITLAPDRESLKLSMRVTLRAHGGVWLVLRGRNMQKPLKI